MGITSKNNLTRLLIIGCLNLVITAGINAQVKSAGTPFIQNYSRLDYRAGQQNWMIDQAADGRMYFANNDGLLEFDGSNWNLIPLPKGIIVRSVYISKDGKIYVGGFNEFGFFEPDSAGRLVYHSLIGLLNPEDRNFDEIWRIHNTPDGLIFQSFTQIIVLNEGEVRIVKAPGKFHFSYFVNGQLLLVDLEKGILRYSMNSFFPLIGTESLKGIEISAILPFGNKLLLATVEKGIFIYDGNRLEQWSNPASDFLTRNQVYTALRLNEDNFAFGTIQQGLMICTREGIVLQKVDRTNGLQNNTILCIYKDNSGNIWLGTDNGIDYIEINSPLSILSYEHGIGAGYAAKRFDNMLYVGTNQGVFYKEWKAFLSDDKDEKFVLIEATRGQVWTLQDIDGHLFCGNNNGTFLINGTDAQLISDIAGGWIYLKLPNHENKLIAGTYSGLALFEKIGNNWGTTKKIKGFDESCRLLEADADGSIWMSHGFKGVFHIFLNEDLDSVNRVDFYNSSNGFNTDFGINVVKIDEKIFFTAPNGVYEYNQQTGSFEKSLFFKDMIAGTGLSKLVEDDKGNVWYFANKQLGVLRKQEDGGFVNINLPFRQIEGNFIGGFEFVYPIDEQNVLIGASDGFIHYNPEQFKNYQIPFSVCINKVSLLNPDSVIFFGHKSMTESYKPVIKFRNNGLYFSYSANDFENPDKTEYSTFLEGYDAEWTNWENRYGRDFTNLHEGEYTFYVKARNIYGGETEAAFFQFTINPPWARTWIAYVIYTVIALLIIWIMLILIKKKMEKLHQKEKMRQQEKFKEREEKLQRETLEAEKEIIRLRNEKLSEEMILKDKELANSTMEMIQKNKLLTKIINDLKKMTSKTIDAEVKSQIQKLSKEINKELDTEKQWEVFETHFENVHEAFLNRLKNQYPELSPRELKLCAYLRMNISSKEIAVLMNISTRGVEISRYRLRRKLKLTRDENLTDFILTY